MLSGDIGVFELGRIGLGYWNEMGLSKADFQHQFQQNIDNFKFEWNEKLLVGVEIRELFGWILSNTSFTIVPQLINFSTDFTKI